MRQKKKFQVFYKLKSVRKIINTIISNFRVLFNKSSVFKKKRSLELKKTSTLDIKLFLHISAYFLDI